MPSRTTTDPGPTSAARIAFHAVVPAIGSVAAASKDRCAGTGTTALAGSATYSASDPGSVTPRISVVS